MRIHNGGVSISAVRSELQGILPSGKQMAFSGMEFNRVGGKVEEHLVGGLTCSDRWSS
jgi:hypothetical protein